MGKKSKSDKGFYAANLTWPEIKDHLQKGALPFLPIGGESKEHGFHLPMNTDYLQARWLTAQAVKKHYVLAFPVVNYAYYPVFKDYAGSITIGADRDDHIYKGMLREIANSVFRAGAEKIFVLDTGVSTTRPLLALSEEQEMEGLYPFLSCFGKHYEATINRLEEQPFKGGHADEMETSLMLHIAPDVVRMDQAHGAPHDYDWPPGYFTPDDENSKTYTPSGATGKPSLASAEKGRALAKARVKDMRQAIKHCLKR